MSSRAKTLKRLRRTKTGWSDDELCIALEQFGFEFQRMARHGYLYRHPVLAKKHPDLDVRKEHAYVLVPRGNEVRRYAAEQVLAAIEALLDYLKEQDDG